MGYERMQIVLAERKAFIDSLIAVRLLHQNFESMECMWTADSKPNWNLVRSVVVGGLLPSVLHVEKSAPRGTPNPEDVREKAKYMRFTILQRHLLQKNAASYPIAIHLHPNSLLWGNDEYQCPWLACFMVQHTSKLYAYDVSEATPYALLLFGEEPEYDENSESIVMGGWVRFKCRGAPWVLPLLTAARGAMHQLLQQKLDNPFVNYAQSRELNACIGLLSTNGLGFEPVRW